MDDNDAILALHSLLDHYTQDYIEELLEIAAQEHADDKWQANDR